MIKRFIAIAIFCFFSASVMLAASPFVFVQISDTHMGWADTIDSTKIDAAVKKINILDPDFLVITGDMTCNMRDIGMEEINAFKKSMSKLTVPVHYVPGNHDIISTNADRIKIYTDIYGRDYYKFIHNNSLFVIMDTNRLLPNDGDNPFEKVQRYWLESNLSVNKNKQYNHVFVFTHIPFYWHNLNEVNSYDNVPSAVRVNYLDMFDKYNVDYVISGHLHEELVNKYKDVNLLAMTSLAAPVDGLPIGVKVFRVYDDRVVIEYMPLDKVIGKICL